jgi:Leucine-rich repeat (LRR) protein/O-acetyl-ADP-ribose deacetylase (regulator of RNase III)
MSDEEDEYYNDGGGGGVEPPHLTTEQLTLGGEELEEYCKKHGLCNLCAQTKTHKRVFRLKKKNQWQPLTVGTAGVYIVFKGYCVQPGCFTLEQAQRLLGEIAPDEGAAAGAAAARVVAVPKQRKTVAQDPESAFVEGQNEEPKGKQRKGISRLLMGRGKKKKGGVAGGVGSFDSMTGFSTSTSNGPSKRKGASSNNSKGTSATQSVSSKQSGSLKSEIRRDDDDVSVGSAMTSMTSASNVRLSLAQLLQEAAGTMLDLSSTRLHHNHITELISALAVATSLETLILENCKLNDNEIEIIGQGLAQTGVAPIKRLSFRSNRMGNRGAVSLQAWFSKTSTLEELDLSKNQIGSRGAASTLHAFRDNRNCNLRMLNFAHNEIWDPDDGSFFSSNQTLELINLEGNFIHDEGIEAIAKGMNANRRCVLQKLFLGWNGIGDEGCMQLARMLESNNSLTTLGLGENDITSVGARALLSSLASNGTLREITGLYHNQIDRKFIVAAIKRLLQSHVEAVDGTDLTTNDPSMDLIFEESLSAMDTLAEPLGNQLPPPEEMSEGSLDWAEKLFAPGQDGKIIPMAERNDPGVPLGNFDKKMEHGPDCACESCQAATLHKQREVSTPKAPPVSRAPTPATAPRQKAPMTFQPMPEPQTDFDRVMVFQSAPLAYFNRETTLHHAVPLRDFDYERHAITKAVESAEKFGAKIELEIEAGHTERLRTFFDQSTSRVLHLSCFGHPEYLAFENEAGYMETMAPEELSNLIKAQNAGPCPLKLVVVNSFHSGRIGKAFVDAGVPHVVCCHHTEIFRDKAATGFIRNLYRGLADNKSLKQAFHMAQESVRIEEISKHVDRYVLLPQKPEEDPYHDVPIFYTDAVPPMGIREEDLDEDEERPNVLPSLPKYFIGREVDMYEVLEALRVDDVVRIGGPKGSGKASLVAATCRYVNQRRKMFGYDEVFWLPPAHGVIPDEDTLFGDLCELVNRMMQGGDMFEDEETMEISDRIQIELEATLALIAIDSRKFATDVAAENLELFLGELLNKQEVNVKVLLISSSNIGEEEIEDDTIQLKPIDFKSTALLFGEVSRFITANGCPAAQSPDEFAALMVPPSVAIIQDQSKFSSSRRTNLMKQMGNGNPLTVIKSGKNMPASAFIQLIGMANTPEVQIDSYKSLEAALVRWSAHRDRAVKSKNYLRAADLEEVLTEIEALRKNFPSLEDLMTKEQELQRKLNLAMSKKQYAAGNNIKREILTLKKVIMTEKRASSLTQAARNQIDQLQRQMNSIMKIAHSSFSDMDNLTTPEVSAASFSLGSAYHHCEVAIYPGSVVHFDPGNDLGAVICWTNECCDMQLHDNGRELVEYGGQSLDRDISSLPGITRTRWGVAKCGTGNAVIVGPGNYDELQVHCVILAVGPLSPSCEDTVAADDEDSLHYTKIMLRSCIRSGLILAKHSQVQAVAFPTLTSKVGGDTYEQTLLMGLKILVEEAKHSDLNNLHIIGKNEEESTKLIAMAIDMGLTMS